MLGLRNIVHTATALITDTFALYQRNQRIRFIVAGVGISGLRVNPNEGFA